MSYEFDRCDRCAEYAWLRTHTCPPTWRCRLDGQDDDEDETPIFARSAEEAAEKYSERYDDDDRTNAPWTRLVLVKPETEDASPQLFEVTMEYVPTYYAREMKKEDSACQKPISPP